jgi:hypothetical protein
MDSLDLTFNNGVATYTALLSSTGGTTVPSTETYSVSNGYFVSSRTSTYMGALNGSKNALIGTMDISGSGVSGHGIRIGVKRGSNYTLADLAGDWRMFGLNITGTCSYQGWERAILVIDSSGNITVGSGLLSDGTVPSFAHASLGTASIASDGTVTTSDNVSFHGVLSTDKTMLVVTVTDSRGGYGLMICVK